jgi:hypothetical protein
LRGAGLMTIRSMALAAQGVSLDPVTGAKRASYKEFPEGGMDDPDARSPILRNHQSYQNPYDIRYVRAMPPAPAVTSLTRPRQLPP